MMNKNNVFEYNNSGVIYKDYLITNFVKTI